MRLFVGVGLLFALAGMSSAQDSNFSNGPQYLMTLGAPMFAHSIATPSLSWENPVPVAATSEPVTSQAAPEQYDAVSSTLESQRPNALYSIYYGSPQTNVDDSLRESSVERPAGPALPAGFVEIGVTSLTDARALREQGYGITLPEAAASRRANTSRSHHVYTNEDLERLRPHD